MSTLELLHCLGVSTTCKGYLYLHYAIELVMEDATYLTALTTRLYPTIAKHFHCSINSTERALRTLINTFWECGRRDYFDRITYSVFKSKPYTGEFIGTLARYLLICNGRKSVCGDH